jgi:anti-anti-sigma factor
MFPACGRVVALKPIPRKSFVQITRDESGDVLKLAGSIEISGAKELQDSLRDFIAGTARAIVDLSEVDACDTAVLQLLYSARKTAERSGTQFEFARLSAAIRDASAALGLSLTEAPDAIGPNPARRGEEHAV